MTEPQPIVSELITVRDWLRFAASQFQRARLVYGHGTSTALDEAAFLILETLHLPIDQLEPWLDARLTRAERLRVHAVIEARVVTRKPASYLTKSAYLGPHRFVVDDRVIVPRSFIAELLLSDGLAEILPPADDVHRALDLCTGSGCLAILAALAFPHATVDAIDLSEDALAVARENIAAYALTDRVTAIAGDLFGGAGSNRYDVILSNPPYVRTAAVEAFPPEYRAEPAMAHDGGKSGLDLVDAILAAAPDHLTADGVLIVEVGQEREALETRYPDLPFLWLDTDESTGEVFALTRAQFGKPATRKTPKKKG